MIVVTIVFFPYLACGTESEWNKYLDLKNSYYYLDNQKFNEISCVINVPLVTELITQIKNQIGPLKDKVKITESLSSFSLTYTPTSGLTFTNPEFDITLIDTEGLADPEKVKQGINMMKNGFNMQVTGVKDTLTGLFEDYQQPVKENYEDLIVTKIKDGYFVKYTSGNNKITENHSGKTVEISQEGNDISTTAIQSYKTTSNDKLILEQASVSITQPLGNIKSDYLLEYQDIGNIIFPRRIKAVFEQTIQTISQKGEFDIYLKNCKIN
jgi:hypothetical protein